MSRSNCTCGRRIIDLVPNDCHDCHECGRNNSGLAVAAARTACREDRGRHLVYTSHALVAAARHNRGRGAPECKAVKQLDVLHEQLLQEAPAKPCLDLRA
jgi:hypothetical protein